jgi:hypothetical protein
VPLSAQLLQILNDMLLLRDGKRQKGREVDNLNIERHAGQPDKSLKRRGLCQDGYRQINKKIMTVRRIF